MSVERRKTIPVKIGHLTVGGSAAIRVQSMTSTDTEDVIRTSRQIIELAQAGSELVRITVNTEKAAEAVPEIVARVRDMGVDAPIIGDFHYNGHSLLTRYPACAAMLDKYRINPGNVGKGVKRDEQFSTMVKIAQEYDKVIRVGVNWGSLDQSTLSRIMDDNARREYPLTASEIMREALIVSAIESAQQAEILGLSPDHIVLSCKVSTVQDLIAIYRQLAVRCQYALHLGLTEAGMGSKGIVASTVAMGILLQEGIGDTIRVSLTPEPGGPRTQEVIVAQELLQTMGLRAFTPLVTACPGCGRTSSQFFQELAQEIQHYVRHNMPVWRDQYDGVESMTLAVMGCIVNGPGESKHANIGISLPGNGEEPACPVFIDGEKAATLRGDTITDDFKKLIDHYVASHYVSKLAT